MTTPSFEVGIGTLFVLGIGPSLVFWLAGTLPIGYRIASSITLLGRRSLSVHERNRASSHSSNQRP